MAVATLKTLYCFQHATGTDGAVNTAVFGLIPDVIALGHAGGAVKDVVEAIPGVIEAIAIARNDPDNLYLTFSTEGGRDSAFWPGPGRDTEMRAGQSVYLGLSYEFNGSMNLSMWDYDDVSRDDLLGSVTVEEAEAGAGEFIKKAFSTIEGSCYLLSYSVD